MAHYAIGDIQGCLAPLERLLERISFDPAADQVWFVGDLVNRGPDSLGVLRLIRSLSASAVTVLGNHDLHLLAIAAGAMRLKPRDTLTNILAAPDRSELLTWLRTRPLLYFDQGLNTVLVHAGVNAAWTVAEALRLAREVETELAGPEGDLLLRHMYGNEPDQWDAGLRGYERWRVIINSFTRMRYCDGAGRLSLHDKGAPGTQAQGLVPWYNVAGRKSGETRIVFGHWSTLGVMNHDSVISLDSGCVWGGALSAIRLEDGEFFRVGCPEFVRPG